MLATSSTRTCHACFLSEMASCDVASTSCRLPGPAAGETMQQLRTQLAGMDNKDIDKVIAQFAPKLGQLNQTLVDVEACTGT